VLQRPLRILAPRHVNDEVIFGDREDGLRILLGRRPGPDAVIFIDPSSTVAMTLITGFGVFAASVNARSIARLSLPTNSRVPSRGRAPTH